MVCGLSGRLSALKLLGTCHLLLMTHQLSYAFQAGQVRISTEAATLQHLAHQFWHRILAMADLNDDQQLSLNELQTLMQVTSACFVCFLGELLGNCVLVRQQEAVTDARQN